MTRVDPAAVVVNLDVPPLRPRPGRGFFVGLMIVGLLCVLGWRMVPHPVGAARTFGKYEGKATSTAKAANSEVAVTRVAAQAATRGNAFGPYTALIVSDAEESISGGQGTFDSIQPPDRRADALRSQLDALLSNALDDVAHVRIAARRGDLPRLELVARSLVDDSRELRAFIEAHS